MIIHTKQCFACDGEGITPSNIYKRWCNVTEEYEEQWNKDHPAEMCCVCSGVGDIFYLDGDEEMFSSLADRWEEETYHISSVDDMINHPCYQPLKKMGGKEVVVFILKRISHKTTLLMILLDSLIKKDHSPITEDIKGKIKDMSMAWVKWGIQRRYISKKYKNIRVETDKEEEKT